MTYFIIIMVKHKAIQGHSIVDTIASLLKIVTEISVKYHRNFKEISVK